MKIICPDCGLDEHDCACLDEDVDPSETDCLWCGGDGEIEGDDPCWDLGEMIPCPSCHGSGLRKDMTLW